MKINDFKVGTTIKTLRKFFNMTQEEFSKKVEVPRSWLSKKEVERDRIYIKDLIDIINKCNADLYIINIKDDRKISIKEYNPGFILKVMREWTLLNMTDFANTIGRKTSWQSENESGNINYYANDLFELAKVNGFELELIFKTKNNN